MILGEHGHVPRSCITYLSGVFGSWGVNRKIRNPQVPKSTVSCDNPVTGCSPASSSRQNEASKMRTKGCCRPRLALHLAVQSSQPEYDTSPRILQEHTPRNTNSDVWTLTQQTAKPGINSSKTIYQHESLGHFHHRVLRHRRPHRAGRPPQKHAESWTSQDRRATATQLVLRIGTGLAVILHGLIDRFQGPVMHGTSW